MLAFSVTLRFILSSNRFLTLSNSGLVGVYETAGWTILKMINVDKRFLIDDTVSDVSTATP